MAKSKKTKAAEAEASTKTAEEGKEMIGGDFLIDRSKDDDEKGTGKKKVAKSAKPGKTAEAKTETTETETPAPKKGGIQGVGIIAGILDIIVVCGPISKKDILTELSKRFPERDVDKMSKTVQCQVGGKKRPLRMEREKKVEFDVTEEGLFSLKK